MKLRLELRPESAALRPSHTLLSWYVEAAPVTQDLRVPTSAALPPDGPLVLNIGITEPRAGFVERRVHVKGLRDGQQVSEGAARIAWDGRSDIEVVVPLVARLGDADADRVPDAIDDDCCAGTRDAGVHGPADRAPDVGPSPNDAADTPPDAQMVQEAPADGPGPRPDTGPPPLTAGLLLSMTFDEGAGTSVADRSGNQNHGTLIRPADARWVDGRSGKTLAYPAPAWVQIAGSPSLNRPLTQMTVGCWLMSESPTTTGYRTIAARRRAGANTNLFWFGLLGNQLRFAFAGVPITRSNVTIEAGRWIHVSATYDGVRLRLFFDGREVDAADHQGMSIPADPGGITVGTEASVTGSEQPAYPLLGRVDDLVIYDRALSAPELVTLAGLAKPPP